MLPPSASERKRLSLRGARALPTLPLTQPALSSDARVHARLRHIDVWAPAEAALSPTPDAAHASGSLYPYTPTRDEERMRERHVTGARAAAAHASALASAVGQALPPLGGAVSFRGPRSALRLSAEAEWGVRDGDGAARSAFGAQGAGAGTGGVGWEGTGGGVGLTGAGKTASWGASTGGSYDSASRASAGSFSAGVHALLAQRAALAAVAAAVKPYPLLRPRVPSCRHVATSWGLRSGRGVRHACAPPDLSTCHTDVERAVAARKHWRYGGYLVDVAGDGGL